MTKENKVTELPTIDTQTDTPETNVESNNLAVDTLHFEQDEFDAETKGSNKKMFLTFTFMFAFSILIFASWNNPGIYQIDKETLVIINQAFNAIVLLVVPFLLGSLGAIARILIAGVKAGQRGVLIVSSGVMAMFSWVAIKSGLLLAIVAPHLDQDGIAPAIAAQTESDFYTLALVAIAVGMFASNLFIFINQRVEQIVSQKALEAATKSES